MLISFLFLLTNLSYIQAQDTIIEYNNYKWKIGGNFIFDHASNYSLSPSLYYVNNFGIEVSRKINKIELESGIYKVTRVQDHIYYVPPHINPNINHWFGPVHYYFLNVPINIVYNTKIFYFGGGTYFDYLIGKKETINVNDVILQKSYYCSIASGVNNNSSHNPEGVK